MDRTPSDSARALDRYRLLSQHARDLVLFVRPPAGRIVEANDAAVAAYGYSRDELLRLNIADLRDPTTVGEIGDQMAQAGDGGLTFETRHRRKDGSVFPVEVSSCGANVAGEWLLLSIIRDVSDRKRAEDAVRRSEVRFRGLFEQSPLSVQLLAPDGRTLAVNRAWERLWGGTLAEHLQDYNLRQDPQLAALGIAPLIERAFAGEAVELPVVGYAPDRGLFAGQTRWVRAFMYPVKDAGGHVEEVVLIHEDITDRRRAEDQVRFQAHLLDSVGQAAIATTADGTVVYWNRAAEALYGWPAAEAVGRNVVDVTPAEPSRVQAAAILDRLRAGEAWSGEFPVRRRDGTVFPAFVTNSPVRDEAGTVTGVIGVSADISERQRAERTARFLADAGATLAAVVDPQSALQQVARLAVPTLADWCVVDLAEAEGQLRRVAVAHADPAREPHVRELTRHPPRTDAPHGAGHVIRTGRSELVRDVTPDMIPAVVRDPAHRAALEALGMKSFLCVPLLSRGRAVGAVSFVANESGRRYDETDLQVAEELGRRAGVALDNARLYEELKEADRRKDEFLALLAHELRNPLAPIRTSLQTLKLAGADPHIAGRAREMMERQVDHLVRLVDDLLDVSRIMRGKVDLRRERVDLSVVVARAADTARPLVEAGRHELTVELPPEPVWLDADAVRIAQVLGNLLTNAAKYTEPGGRIRLTAGVESGWLAIRVRDTGIGIPADMLDRVFDPFVQTDAARGRSQGGLGLGLALVRSLVELHGGTVAAASEGAGRGSEFVVRLPTLPGADGRLPVAEGGPVIGTRPSALDNRLRVLVVDDNRDAADSLGMLLKLKGHEARVTYDGPTALATAAAFGPDVVLLDLGMSGMDGYEVARRLRQAPEGRRCLLAALTGWGQEEDRRRTREAGFDRHLVKPVDPAELTALLEGVSRNRSH